MAEQPKRTVLVNDRCLLVARTGISVYIENLLRFWPPEAEFQAEGFFQRRGLLSLSGKTRKCRHPLRLIPLRRFLSKTPRLTAPKALAKTALLKAYEHLFAASLRRGSYAAYLEPNCPPVPTGGFTVSTCCDLSVLDHPRWQPPDRVKRWRRSLQAACRFTNHWITLSTFSKERMKAVLGLPEERITVIPLAARPLPAPPAEWARVEAPPERYILHVGTLEPRKNLHCLLEAYARLPERFRRRVKLILAGGKGWGEMDFWLSLSRHRAAGEVLAAGEVSDTQLSGLLRCALALAMPSWYEGFGLPVLEAMSVGVPVLCSNAEALGEVAGGAALVLDPRDPGAWAEAIRRVAEDDKLRARLSLLGKARASEFSWRKTAASHAALFEKLLA